MPFQSKAQRRKFYALKDQGKMSQSTIDEWESGTVKKGLPERKKKKRKKAKKKFKSIEELRKYGKEMEKYDEE
jgi:hypothetical protein